MNDPATCGCRACEAGRRLAEIRRKLDEADAAGAPRPEGLVEEYERCANILIRGER